MEIDESVGSQDADKEEEGEEEEVELDIGDAIKQQQITQTHGPCTREDRL
jgi:hypothetical protein